MDRCESREGRSLSVRDMTRSTLPHRELSVPLYRMRSSVGWIDSHCHGTDPVWRDSIDSFLHNLAAEGCEALVMGGIEPEEWEAQRRLPEQHLRIIRVFGLHPWTVLNRSDTQLATDWRRLTELLPEADGLGETGLDFHKGPSAHDRQRQRQWLQKHLQLAIEYQKPLVLHIVRAYPDVWHLLRSFQPEARGMIHGFWASLDQARPFLDAGWLLSPNFRLLRTDPHGILKHFPREQIVFESDAPFSTSTGAVTTPLLARQAMEHAATLWLETPEEVMNRQRRNLASLFPRLQSDRLSS
jgi:TatD DNase family protein